MLSGLPTRYYAIKKRRYTLLKDNRNPIHNLSQKNETDRKGKNKPQQISEGRPHPYNQLMLSNSSRNIENLITKLLIDGRYKKAIEKGLRNYQIKQFKVDSLLPNQIFSIFYDSKPDSNHQSWYENELRIFIWVLVGYSYLEERCVSKMTQQDWLFFSHIFNNRNPEIFQFQALSILKKEVKFLKWTEEEIKLLDSIIKSKKIKNKWNQIAKELFLLSQKRFFRTAKQCREHWINHLDPKPIRSIWKVSEDIQLVNAVKVVGKKWARVSKMLNGTRTEHMVKNRFKSLEHLQIKICQNNFHKNPSEEEVLIELEKRLQLALIIESKKAAQEIKKQAQVSNNVSDLKFPSAEGLGSSEPDKENTEIQEDNILDQEDENNEEDQLLKFTLKAKTFHSFRSIYDDDQCKIQEENQECIDENFSNFFDSEYAFE